MLDGRIVDSIRPFRALVVGDFMLDTYTSGKVKRISPEAPVPVLEVLKQESRPGGAGNVVLNLTTVGARVFAVGRIGADGEGEELKEKAPNRRWVRTDRRVALSNAGEKSTHRR